MEDSQKGWCDSAKGWRRGCLGRGVEMESLGQSRGFPQDFERKGWGEVTTKSVDYRETERKQRFRLAGVVGSSMSHGWQSPVVTERFSCHLEETRLNRSWRGKRIKDKELDASWLEQGLGMEQQAGAWQSNGGHLVWIVLSDWWIERLVLSYLILLDFQCSRDWVSQLQGWWLLLVQGWLGWLGLQLVTGENSQGAKSEKKIKYGTRTKMLADLLHFFPTPQCWICRDHTENHILPWEKTTLEYSQHNLLRCWLI